MAWPEYRETVTVVDVLESGACFSGVVAWVESNNGMIAGPAELYSDNEYILAATFGNGNGYGNGYGYGDGDGYGDGYGNGYGNGNGNGYGNGNGNGYGN